MKRVITWFCVGAVFVGSVSICGAKTPGNVGQLFTSPEDAAQALAQAARNKDRDALRRVLGPASDELQTTDKIQGDQQLTTFAEAFDFNHKFVQQPGNQVRLEVGTNNWPLPIPIVLDNGRYYFDTEAGKEEIINRRVGRNEISTLKTMRAYSEAQREYASRDRDGDGVLEYAQKVLSTPGQKDGLYWSPQLDGELSPIGPLVAEAQGEGYAQIGNKQPSGPRPFHGYYYKILTRQGKNAPGGKYDYVINRNMIGGFAMVAWPADYGDSGVMSFIINQQGVVYQKDLGASTDAIARKMDTYDPDPSWKQSPD